MPFSPIRFLSVAAVALFVTGALLAPAPPLVAQDEPPSGDPNGAIVVGTFQSQQVAEAVGYREQLAASLGALEGEVEAARAAGDQEALRRLQAEALRIQQETADALVARIEAVLPSVAEETGAHLIATGLGYAAPGVETRDVTAEVIAALREQGPPPTEAPQGSR